MAKGDEATGAAKGRGLGTLSARVIGLSALMTLAIISAAFTLTYVSTTRILEQQTADTVQAEVEGLREAFRDGGPEGLTDTVNDRARDDSAAVYLLADGKGGPLAGNLSKWPTGAPIDGRWLRVRLTRAATGQEIEIGARAFKVDENTRLLVGRDLAAQRSFQEALIEAGAVALLVAVLLAAGAGFLLNRLVMRRIGDIDHTARAIVAGDLATRIPVRSSGDEFGRLAVTLNAMLERIEVLVVELRTITDSLSHDLRTPLTRLKTQIQRAADSDLEAPTRRDALGAAADEADRILASFSAMIDIARAEAGAAKDQFTELDLTPMMEDIFELHQPLAEESGVKLSFAGDEPVKVRGHAQFLAQLVSNLVDNAMKHGALKGTTGEKTISMSVHSVKGFAEIEVADNGPGIAEDQRPSAIKRFGRLDAARTTPGSGLGLSLAATLARMHSGELLLEDNNPGLKVRVRLPLAS